MSIELKVKEFAALERVHEQTVRDWIRKGAVTVRRTPGGGLRIVTEGSSGGRGSVIISPAGPTESHQS